MWREWTRRVGDQGSVACRAGLERSKVYVTFVKEIDGHGLAVPAQAHVDAIERWLSSLRDGFPLGGPPYPSRDELYDRGH